MILPKVMRYLILPTLCILFASSNAIAATVALGASADTYVQVGSSSNFGTAAALQVKTDNSGTNNQFSRYAMISFDLTTADSFGTLLSADLKIAFSGTYSVAGSTFRVYGVNDGGPSEGFTETSLTYSNWGHGVNTDPFGLVTTNLTDLGLFSGNSGNGAAGTALTLSGASLLSFLNSDTNNTATFLIARVNNEAGNIANFASKENTTVANRPSLTLSNVPEPSHALLSLCGLGMLAVRRRR